MKIYITVKFLVTVTKSHKIINNTITTESNYKQLQDGLLKKI